MTLFELPTAPKEWNLPQVETLTWRAGNYAGHEVVVAHWPNGDHAVYLSAGRPEDAVLESMLLVLNAARTQ